MSKKKVISIIVGVVVVLGGVWFLMEKRGVTSNLVEENQIQPEVQIPLDESKVVEDESEKAPAVDVEKKFNELMVKARTAFGASNYAATIQYYNEALTYKKDDTAYVGLYTVYLTQKNWTKALESINKAIAVSALYGDYWKWKLLVMAEGMNASFAELEKVYTEGLPKVKSQEKINLVTYFADLSAKKGEKSYAVNLWQKAIEMNPESKDVYQKEIDNLENI